MRGLKNIAVLIALVGVPAAVQAQSSDDYLQCRYNRPYPKCDEKVIEGPNEGEIGIEGLIIEVNSHVCPDMSKIRLNVLRSTQGQVAGLIELGFGACTRWHSELKVGDRLVAALVPRDDGRDLSFNCAK